MKKTSEIQRSIRLRSKRKDGDAPNIGQVARVRDVEFPVDGQHIRKRSRGSNATSKKTVLTWSVWLGLGTIALITLAVYLWLNPYLSRVTADTSAPPPTAIKVRVESKFPSPSRDQAVDLVTRAMTEIDPVKVESRFRLGTASLTEVVDFLKGMEARDGAIERYDWLSSMDSGGLLLEGVLVGFKGKEKPVERLAFLTPDAAGNWKLDFGAFARTVSPSWSEILNENTNQATVRVFMGRDSYYNGPFSDEKEWICYGMASPDMELLLRGYCKVGSPQAEDLNKLFSDERRVNRGTLEIRRLKGGEERQFEITRMIAEDWVIPDAVSEKE